MELNERNLRLTTFESISNYRKWYRIGKLNTEMIKFSYASDHFLEWIIKKSIKSIRRILIIDLEYFTERYFYSLSAHLGALQGQRNPRASEMYEVITCYELNLIDFIW